MSEEEQKDRETMALLKKEYELYKDKWGLNIKYSHEAGASTNYSKTLLNKGSSLSQILTSFSSQDSLGPSSGTNLL